MVQSIPVPLKHSLGMHQLISAISECPKCVEQSTVERRGNVQEGWGVRIGKRIKLGMMDGAAGKLYLCMSINTIPNATVNVIMILYTLTPKLQKRVLDHCRVRDE